ncbi:MFS transporter [Companilactobacillus bobalius]|uniref:MFS transporter n=1 Tax=Companilactobacillus bobalius TaxID=2801451 RepID=UPI0013027A13|nr:MFS transporter [Companilactobacillus bobalius]KAE9560501.1 MFS transporter [Companilactobacillus bobalius]
MEATTDKRISSTWILILTSLGFFMSMMDSMIVTTASTAIRTDFHISVNTLQWALNAYNITIGAVLLVGVSLGERIGRRRIYNIGIFIFTLGSVFCALSSNINVLIVARIIEGIGASVMTPMSMAILTNNFSYSERGAVTTKIFKELGAKIHIGPSLGGLIVAKLTWQFKPLDNVPIGLVAIYLSKRILPESTGNSDKIGLLDSLLVIFASAGIIWSLSEITAASSKVISALVGILSLVLGIWFVVRPYQQDISSAQIKYFRSKAFTGGNVATFLLYAAMYGVVFFLPQFLQVVGRADSLTTGLEILPWTGTLVVVAPFAGKAVDKFGEKLIATLGLILQGIGYLLLSILVTEQSSYLIMIIPLALAGIGLSMAGPALQKSVLGAVDPTSIGKASGIYNVFRLMGGALGTTISVIVFYRFGNTIDVSSFTNGFRAAMMCAGLMSLMGILFSFWVKDNN